jgi:hypothetical protein
MPQAPTPFRPQHHKEPSALSATEWVKPAEMAMTFDSPDSPMTCSGVALGSWLPVPSWPTRFSPHARTVPSAFKAIA